MLLLHSLSTVDCCTLKMKCTAMDKCVRVGRFLQGDLGFVRVIACWLQDAYKDC